MKLWLKQLFCVHHWHKIEGTKRKVANKGSPICERDSEQNKKYVRDGTFGLDEIVVKYVRVCCFCSKKGVGTIWVEATVKQEYDKAMSFPDFDENPLKL